ncbi:MAG: ABC transporter permease [Candidatus Aminicenantes bacterium]|nr:ABC transporter permease [Candidatus Aminicenantes bacterium]
MRETNVSTSRLSKKKRWIFHQKSFLSYLSVLALWYLASRLGWFESTILPPPTEVIKTLINLIVSGQLFADAGISIWRVLVGFTIAAIIGIGFGILTASSSRFKEYGSPLLEILRPIPPVAFVPIAILWFGIGNGPAYFLVSFAAFFPIYTNTLAGILSVSQIHYDAALCLGAKRRLLLMEVSLPASMPYLLAGLKTGLGTAWFVVIVAELVGAQSGLGYMIQLNRLTLQSEKVLAGMIAIGFLGFSMNKGMSFLQKRFIPWYAES